MSTEFEKALDLLDESLEDLDETLSQIMNRDKENQPYSKSEEAGGDF
jgi:hypothetical protein